MASCEGLLPAGFRFHPTDEELIVHYLRNRAASLPCPAHIVAELDVYKFDPWDLPAKAVCGEREWYFFTPRDRKYPNGVRPNRAAGSGYWKATGVDKQIAGGSRRAAVGVKKVLVFYVGKPPKGTKTNWVMHEYRLAGAASTAVRLPRPSMRLDDWVLCRIYQKGSRSPSYQKAQEVISMEPQQYYSPLGLPANAPEHADLSVLCGGLRNASPGTSEDTDLFSISNTQYWNGPGRNEEVPVPVPVPVPSTAPWKMHGGDQAESCGGLSLDGANYWQMMLMMNSQF